MRVIAGKYKGRRLITPDGLDTRPTADRVKEALFSIIQFDLEGAVFLDIFAGSGQMGIEALSRGAERATFVDFSKQSIECINKNAGTLGISDSCRVVMRDVKDFLLTCTEKYDIVFSDSPYKKGITQSILPDLTRVVKDNGTVICEIEKGEQMPENENGFSLLKRYRYGKTELAVYRKMSAQEIIY